jgi:metal-sulfur cluster biosynthetic enzyme
MSSHLPETAAPSAEDVLTSLTRVIDPAYGINIVDLGIVYGVAVERDIATIQLTLTSPDSRALETIEPDIREVLLGRHPGLADVTIELVWDPPWRDDFITEAGRLQMLNPLPRRPAADTAPPTEDDIRDSLMFVLDPEVGINVVDLGLVYGIMVEGNAVHIDMTLTTPGCPLHSTIAEAVQRVLETRHPSLVDIQMDLVWDPPWDTSMITESGRTQLGW